MVESNPELSRLFKSVTEFDGVYAYDSSGFVLVGCDMVKVQQLHGKLQAAGIDWSLPTIVLTGTIAVVQLKKLPLFLISKTILHFILVNM